MINFSATKGFERYSEFPLSKYHQSLLSNWPIKKADQFNLYVNIEDPEFLVKRFDLQQLKKTVESYSNESFAEIVHNYFEIVFRVELSRFVDDLLVKLSNGNFLFYNDKKTLFKGSINVCAQITLNLMTDLTQQFVAKAIFNQQDTRSQIITQFNELAQRIKAETQVCYAQE
jgi:hypothetical protein